MEYHWIGDAMILGGVLLLLVIGSVADVYFSKRKK